MDLVFKATLGYKNCGINFVDINEWNSDEEHNREYNSAKKRLIHPCSRIRDVYSSSQIKISVNEDKVNHNDFSDVFAFNHQHSNMFDYDFSFKIPNGFPISCNIIGLITSRKLGSALGLQSLNMLLTIL